MTHLILVRHGKSVWNALGLWTGWTDVALAEEGFAEARDVAENMRSFSIHEAHVSGLLRARQTLEEIQKALKLEALPIKTSIALNERHYGIHTGKNKWQVKEEVGEETFHKIRRSWDHPIPEGETLKDVHGRVVAYYSSDIIPSLAGGKNVLVVAHGNSLRALIKHIEQLSDEDIGNVEVETGEAHCYLLSESGMCLGKEVRSRQK